MNEEEIKEKIISEGKSFILNQWSYYIQLEKMFLETESYVSIHKNNYKCYSTKYTELLFLICGEIEMISKIICKNIDNNFKFSDLTSIEEWFKIIETNEEIADGIINFKVKAQLYDFEYVPWLNVRKETPSWWTAHNKLKHNRINNVVEATLENTFNALAGLFVLEKIYFQIISNNHHELCSKLYDGIQYFVPMDEWFYKSIFEKQIDLGCYL
ncbi:MAG: hypothetical protein J1F31_04305 [Erysipelotrichales bacterium]|nr:hypothetical protein [Erysipelotrichales bacterium]